MDFEGIAISKLLDKETCDRLWPQFKSDMFIAYKEAYETIADYRAQYGAPPTLSYLRSICRGTVPSDETIKASSSEPDSIIVDMLRDRLLYNTIRSSFPNVQKALSGGDTSKAVDIVKNLIKNFDDIESDSVIGYMGEYAPAVYEKYDKIVKGEPSGIILPFHTMDKKLGFLDEEEFAVVAARPSTGKTWLLLMFAYAWWKEGYKVLFVSPEMSGKAITRRLLAIHMGLNPSELRHGSLSPEEADLFRRKSQELFNDRQNTIMILADKFGHTVEEIDAAVSTAKPDVVITDAIYLLRSRLEPRQSNWEAVKVVVDALTRMAKRHSIPVLGSNQFNRGNDGKTSGEQGNVAYSDAFAQDADFIFSYSEYSKGMAPGGIRDVWAAERLMSNRAVLLQLKAIKTRDAEADLNMLMARDLDDMLIYDLGPMVDDGIFTPDYGVIYSFGKEVMNNPKRRQRLEELSDVIATHSETHNLTLKISSKQTENIGGTAELSNAFTSDDNITDMQEKDTDTPF